MLPKKEDNYQSSAIFSEDRKYRYALSRTWDFDKPAVMFVMLNPSTANENDNDPTVRRCIEFAKQWGYGTLHITNLFALVATDPKELATNDNPIGENNHSYIKEYGKKSKAVVFAWGANTLIKNAHLTVANMFPLAYCLQKTAKGAPQHPLYVKGDVIPNYFKPVEKQ